MTPERLARLVAHERWQIRVGMRMTDLRDPTLTGTVTAIGRHGFLVTIDLEHSVSQPWGGAGHWRPDLTDAATAGCLLEMTPGYDVRNHCCGAGNVSVTVFGDDFATIAVAHGATLGEAAALALADAWGVP